MSATHRMHWLEKETRFLPSLLSFPIIFAGSGLFWNSVVTELGSKFAAMVLSIWRDSLLGGGTITRSGVFGIGLDGRFGWMGVFGVSLIFVVAVISVSVVGDKMISNTCSNRIFDVLCVVTNR